MEKKKADTEAAEITGREELSAGQCRGDFPLTAPKREFTEANTHPREPLLR